MATGYTSMRRSLITYPIKKFQHPPDQFQILSFALILQFINTNTCLSSQADKGVAQISLLKITLLGMWRLSQLFQIQVVTFQGTVSASNSCLLHAHPPPLPSAQFCSPATKPYIPLHPNSARKLIYTYLHMNIYIFFCIMVIFTWNTFPMRFPLCFHSLLWQLCIGQKQRSNKKKWAGPVLTNPALSTSVQTRAGATPSPREREGAVHKVCEGQSRRGAYRAQSEPFIHCCVPRERCSVAV